MFTGFIVYNFEGAADLTELKSHMQNKGERQRKELAMDHHKKVQTSEAFINSAFLAVSGGFQDAYTYFTRDGVFSNAQTGNVVLMSERFMNGEVKAGLHYLVPLTAF